MRPTWWNAPLISADGTNARRVPPLLWLYTCASGSCLRAAKSVLGVSAAATSGSHLLVKDLASFKLPTAHPTPLQRGPILCAKLSRHWWHQMTSAGAYSPGWTPLSSDATEQAPSADTPRCWSAPTLRDLYTHFLTPPQTDLSNPPVLFIAADRVERNITSRGLMFVFSF